MFSWGALVIALFSKLDLFHSSICCDEIKDKDQNRKNEEHATLMYIEGNILYGTYLPKLIKLKPIIIMLHAKHLSEFVEAEK